MNNPELVLAALLNVWADVTDPTHSNKVVPVSAGQSSQSLDEASKRTSSGFLSSTTRISQVQTSSATAIGSSLEGNTVSLRAGKDLTAQGASITAAGTTTLQADNKVNLLASSNTSTESSQSSNYAASLGVAAQLGNAGRGQVSGIGLTASASAGKGTGNGSSTTFTNTQVAGNTVTITSGGDTNLKGAVVSGNTVQANVGGNLNIQSLQDRANYSESSQQVGGSVMVGMTQTGVASGNINLAKSNIDSSYASVTEQSAIKAGDGGFNVNVQGNTALVGGAITSTQAAVDASKNRFATGGTLTTSDIQNNARYEASSVSVNLGTGSTPGQSASAGLSGVGLGSDKGAASSTTTAGISGVAGDAAKRSGDSGQGIAKIFDADKVRQEIQAQTVITQEFGKQAGAAITDFATTQRKALQEQAKNAATPEEKAQAEKAIKDVNMQERALNILVSGLTGMAGAVVTKEALSTAAEKMRDLMIEDSKKFPGVVDSTGKVLSNVSGQSEGVRGDGTKVGGTRVDLDILCGASNERCKTVTDQNGAKVLDLNSKGQVQFDEKAAGMSMAQFLATPEGQKLPGATGGIQGEKGTLFGVPYAPGSWQDKLIESFAGTHDFIGGKFSGLYDAQGNAARGRSELTTTLQNRWSEIAVLPAAPFAAAEGMSPQVWKAIGILLGAGNMSTRSTD